MSYMYNILGFPARFVAAKMPVTGVLLQGLIRTDLGRGNRVAQSTRLTLASTKCGEVRSRLAWGRFLVVMKVIKLGKCVLVTGANEDQNPQRFESVGK
jgi:hypothetical protein